MEEKVLIQSYCPDTKTFFKVALIIALVLSLVFFMRQCSSTADYLEEYKETYKVHQKQGYCYRYSSNFYGDNLYSDNCEACQIVKDNSAFGDGFAEAFKCFIWVMLLALLIKLLLTSFSLVVTDKRVYCKSLWIHHVCLPVDSITAVARIGILNCLAIGAPAGRIYGSFVMNSREIYDILNDLFVARQEKSLAAIMGMKDTEKPTPSATNSSSVTCEKCGTKNAAGARYCIACYSEIGCSSVADTSKVPADSWKCRCGRIHKKYVASCSCGATQREVSASTVAPVTAENSNKANTPISAEIRDGEKVCPKCGAVQRADRRVCWTCGQPFDN